MVCSVKNDRIGHLVELFNGLLIGEHLPGLVKNKQQYIDEVNPSDVIALVDRLVLLDIPMPELKKSINKILNLFFTALNKFPKPVPQQDSFLFCLMKNNEEMEIRLKAIRPLLKNINKGPAIEAGKEELKEKFINLEKFNLHYIIKENVLFPALENAWSDYRCLQVMWSFHDDIRRNVRSAILLLEQAQFDLKLFNRLMGDIFFNMLAIKFREERLLFPRILETIPGKELDEMLRHSLELGFPYHQPKIEVKPTGKLGNNEKGQVDLETGFLSAQQIIMLFNHLPVDITFVDENNRVRYFSSPEKRIFPRSNAIIGRDVKNCHPPESVHIVDQIIDTFKKGEQDKASFWINRGSETVLIQYFAIRDKSDIYRGVVEVSQEISDIKNIKGEKRLLEWT